MHNSVENMSEEKPLAITCCHEKEVYFPNNTNHITHVHSGNRFLYANCFLIGNSTLTTWTEGIKRFKLIFVFAKTNEWKSIQIDSFTENTVAFLISVLLHRISYHCDIYSGFDVSVLKRNLRPWPRIIKSKNFDIRRAKIASKYSTHREEGRQREKIFDKRNHCNISLDENSTRQFVSLSSKGKSSQCIHGQPWHFSYDSPI